MRKLLIAATAFVGLFAGQANATKIGEESSAPLFDKTIPTESVIGVAWPLYPDIKLTPGATNDPPTPLPTLCADHYSSTVRHVTPATKLAVYARYGLPKVERNAEVDHDVPLVLDGRNDLTNLWPQSYLTVGANAHRKDVLEVKLYRLVCSHALTLLAAQNEIRGDWRPAYIKYVGPLEAPLPPTSEEAD